MCCSVLNVNLVYHLGTCPLILDIKVNEWEFSPVKTYSKIEKKLRYAKYEIDPRIYTREEVKKCAKVTIPGLETFSVTDLIKNDGNNIFRAISMLIEGSQSNHLQYRKSVVSHIQAHPDRYGWTTHGKDLAVFRDLCKLAKQDGQRGFTSQTVLQILADVYERNLIVLRDEPTHGLLETQHFEPSQNPKQKPFHLLYQHGDHFEILLENERFMYGPKGKWI